ncbi:glycosyltransferase family 4 protein [Pontibacter liquoris]|uniref:glycosyltransferase family 4 protein n=1 Tax=Pontibacter liquoris TaxID=2905677 RepID=UPI001FA752AD|nr:glycosyltransferase family 4 protein [Pontibacter liquoris]
MKRLAVVATHPVQYNAPIFRMLSAIGKLDLKVFYTWFQAKEQVFDPGFGKVITWDIPLLEGYSYLFTRNKTATIGPKTFWSIQNPELIKEIEDYNPDAILVIGWNYYSHLQVMRHFNGKVPVLFRGDSTLLNDKKGIKKQLRRLVLRQIYRYVDFALFVGSQNKAYYLEHGLKPEQLIFAPHAIENNRFSSDIDGEADLWAKNNLTRLGIPAAAKVFLYAGKLESVKNPELLLKAFAAPAIDAHLILVGNGQLEFKLKSKYKNCAKVHYMDFQNQTLMPAVYRMADVFVLGSDSETWGLAVNEAMACGKAVLVSDKVGCAIDLVQPGVNGFIFEAGSIDSLQEKLHLLSSMTKAELSYMGKASALKIQDWNYDKICVAVEELLKG